MDKLIELLNEYDGEDLEYGFIDGEIRRKVRNFNDERNTWKQVVWYTKQFGFIDWLVDNEKINKDKVKLLSVFQETWYYNLYQSLLMILSIQDNPLDFLVKILK